MWEAAKCDEIRERAECELERPVVDLEIKPECDDTDEYSGDFDSAGWPAIAYGLDSKKYAPPILSCDGRNSKRENPSSPLIMKIVDVKFDPISSFTWEDR
jgi:hypothetical protein